MSFGENLTKLRKERGMSQEDLASNLNVSRQAVSKWESNSSYPETDNIVAICKLFNCSMDELIGLKEVKSKKRNYKIINCFNNYFDIFIKGIKLFYSMTFKQKIKCILEMFFYIIFLLGIIIIFNAILIEIFIKLLYLLPNEILYILVQTFRGLLYLLELVLSTYILIKLYRARYLDYYVDYNSKKENPEIIEEHNVKNINIKEEKIIIRDPEKDFKLFSYLKAITLFFIKTIAACISIGIIITFVILIACTIFVFYFINYGSLIIFISTSLLGLIIAFYVVIELLIKFIFNMKQNPKKLFILFLIALFILGISTGLFACELTTYKINDKIEYKDKIFEEKITMHDNLIIDFLDYIDTDIIIEEREDVLIEYYVVNKDYITIETYIHDLTSYCNNSLENYKKFNVYDFYINNTFNGNSFNKIIKETLKEIKHKEIKINNNIYSVKPKIYISDDNYNKLIQNDELFNIRNNNC